MRLVEKHIIKKSHSLYNECDSLCFKSKNLYNYANYIVMNEFKTSSKNKELGLVENATYLNYNKINRMLIDEKQFDMYELPIKVSNQTLMKLDNNWNSFFRSIKDYKKNPNKYHSRPKLPKFLDKVNGRFMVTYENGAISKKRLKHGIISLSRTNIEISSKRENINQVRIVPRIDHYVIEVVYTVSDTPKLNNNERFMGIDLGVNNLATITSNTKELKPIIINGRPLKSMNQFYNKKAAELKSILETRNKQKSSNNYRKLTNKRNRKIDNYLHVSSKKVVEIAIKNKINTIIIGRNENWKQEVKMGNKNNQSFVNIPHSRFINMIAYKCEIAGINVILQEESFTSKASFLDLDYIPTYGVKEPDESYGFSGYRQHRGLYKLKGEKRIINADVNGSYNILRKAIPNAFPEGTEGVSVHPLIIKIKN